MTTNLLNEQRGLSKRERQALLTLLSFDTVDWMEHNLFVPDARDPDTGKELGPGLIRLSDEQKCIIRAATSRINGLFQFTTILYSAVKKSGKTRVAAGVVSWYAHTMGAFNEVYCIANDGKQSGDRLLAAVKQSIQLAQKLDPETAMAGWHITKPRVELPGGTFIEAIPCDPSGQAGSNPGMTAWSEMWGYRHEHKERLWSEMTVPPTRWGKAIRWVESYAGYSGESNVLESLYQLGVHGSRRHPAFPNLPVYVNGPARMFCYWDHTPRMPWQTPEYYAQEASILRPDEFRRIHRNEWVDPVDKAIPIEWWDECQDVVRDGEPLPKLDSRTPIVIALDASVSHDCCAAVGVTRHPHRKKEAAIRLVRVWAPPKGGKINLTDTIWKFLVEARKKYHVVMVPYDEYQLAKIATDTRQQLGLRVFDFSQTTRRAVADKQLYEAVIHKTLTHTGHLGLRSHVDNAAVKQSGTSMRFVKPNVRTVAGGITAKPIDALVAASMATFECLRLNLG